MYITSSVGFFQWVIHVYSWLLPDTLSRDLLKSFFTGISHEKGRKDTLIPDMRELYSEMIREHGDTFERALAAIMAHDFSTGAILCD